MKIRIQELPAYLHKRFTARQLSKDMDVSLTAAYKFRRGDSTPKPDTLERLGATVFVEFPEEQ